ncbi:hypothetical protein MMC29_000891 [Sticta canariensis]|nr:hypothetical protein [Sticta canariensis]
MTAVPDLVSVRNEEKWKREKGLGQGSSGIVWLERCFHGDSKGEVRAVKKVQKLEPSNYYRELEAIALFSHTKYEQCFVKSFGWYDDDDHIFITMEYLPNGDLHKYLNSPLPEKEGQQIGFQILEGLHHMHDMGFTHRDLKPANILIVCKGPDWWVKIADFGISKRATEGCTVLRTQIGTPAFAAPEVLGYFQLDDTSNDSYTNAVDIWSLGVIIFLILTGEPIFENQRRLGQYVAGSFTFPLEVLLANKVSAQGCDFVRRLLASRSEDRPTVKECLRSPWLHYPVEASETQRVVNNSSFSPKSLNHSEPEPSASWSTQDQISAHETHRSIGVLSEKATSDKTTEQLSSQLANHTYYWERTMELESHSNGVWGVAFSPEGKQIASASFDRTIRLWDSATGAARSTLKGHSGGVRAVAFSPDGKQIASASDDQTIRLWDSATGAARSTLKGHSDRVQAVAFSPDGKQIASASFDQTIRL